MRKAFVLSLLVLMVPTFTLAASCPALSRALSYGSRGTDASQLQSFLIEGGFLAQGNITGYFGRLTEAALKNFQCSRGLVCAGSAKDTGYGLAGPRTREAIKSMCSGTIVITDAPADACTFNNQVVPKGLSVLAYEAPSAAFGQFCVSEMRTCDGGYLSGSYRYASCTLVAAQSCVFNGQILVSGTSVTAYQSTSASAGAQCASEQRTCMNGTLSGSYQNPTCEGMTNTATPPPAATTSSTTQSI